MSRRVAYVLRAVVYLASRPDGPVTAATVAESLEAPDNYLGKILHSLVRAGVLVSTRGPEGGYELSVPPEGLTLEQVAEMSGGRPTPGRWLMGSRECPSATSCPLHASWTRVSEPARTFLRETTVRDVLRDAGDLRAQRRGEACGTRKG